MTTTTNTTRPRPWQRRTIRRPRPDVIVVDDPPLAQLTIYTNLVLLSRRQGEQWTQYPVDASAIADAFSNAPQHSGLLPRNTLATGRIAGRRYLVQWIPPQRTMVRTPEREYTIPLPPLIWAGCHDDYRIWALASGEAWPERDSPLYVAPFPNTYRNGSICWGNADHRLVAAAGTMDRMFDLYLHGSLFNAHVQDGKSKKYPQSILARWKTLARRNARADYPLDDLVAAQHTLHWLCSGGPWKGDSS